jgi:alcohol dehydrogenase (cytochrome c)
VALLIVAAILAFFTLFPIGAMALAWSYYAWRCRHPFPAPGEPGSETWKVKNNAWQTGGGAMWVTGSYDAATNQVLWGTGNPVPMYDPYYRPGDNLFTNSLISWDADNGKMNWFHQYVPGDSGTTTRQAHTS